MRSPARQQQQQQQQQQTQPPVVVVQQPVVVDGRRRTYPFLLRGARFSDGCKIPGQLFLTMVVFGAMCSFMGIMTTSFMGSGSSFTGIPMLLIGIGLLVPGMWLCVTAKRQFDDLPSDHPHRLKYGTGYRIPVSTFNTTTYAIPATSVTSPVGPNAGYPVMTAEQAARHLGQATGQTYVFPYPPAGQSGHTLPAGGQTEGPPPRGRGSSSAPPADQEPTVQPCVPEQQPSFTDPPPPYSEISKDSSFKPYV